MGEIAEMVLEGLLCEGCGEYMDGPPPGHPRYCSRACAQGRGVAPKHIKRAERRAKAASLPHPIGCHSCSKRFRFTSAMLQHARAVHKEQK